MIEHYFQRHTRDYFPDFMPGWNAYANDNSKSQDWKRCKRLNDNWDQYDKIEMTRFGPIGIKFGYFWYLDPEVAEWRN